MAVTWFVSPHLAHLPIDRRVRRLTTVHLPSGATLAFGNRSWFVAFDTCRCCCCCWRLLCFGGCSGRDRFSSNLPTPLSDRCSPSLWKAASSAAPLQECEICVVVDEFDIEFVARFLHFHVDVRPSIWIGSTLRRQYAAHRDGWCQGFRLPQYLRDVFFYVSSTYVTRCFVSTTNDGYFVDSFRFNRVIDHLFDIGASGA